MGQFEHYGQTLQSKKDIPHPKMGQLVDFLLHPPLSEIVKKLGKILKYTPLSKYFRHRWR